MHSLPVVTFGSVGVGGGVGVGGNGLETLYNKMFEELDEISSQVVLPDDIWDKFQLPMNEDGNRDDFLDDIDYFDFENLFSFNDQIRNHDCMWAGHCGSKEHPVDEVRSVNVIKPIQITACQTNAQQPSPINKQPVTIQPGRSLLLKTQQQQHLQQQQQQTQEQTSLSNVTTTNNDKKGFLTGLDSPPNSDDEDVKINKTNILQALQEVISICDINADEDLCEYFNEKEMIEDLDEEDDEDEDEEEEEEKPEPKVISNTSPSNRALINKSISQFVNDHSYHKDKNASMRLNNLGIETPSDSEEEIDVVSVGDKRTTNTGRATCGGALPTNPTSRDRHHLQRTMASAMCKNQGIIKVLHPNRKTTTGGSGTTSSSVEHSPVKRRPPVEARGIKRGRHRFASNSAPYKKRNAYNHSSDSEPEPVEKRIEHNNMERQRRIDLRNAFEDLRTLVPEVKKRERAPKVIILREASLYCDKLTHISEGLCTQLEEMRRHQNRLRARVSQLRLSLASKHQ